MCDKREYLALWGSATAETGATVAQLLDATNRAFKFRLESGKVVVCDNNLFSEDHSNNVVSTFCRENGGKASKGFFGNLAGKFIRVMADFE